ncbi:MAG: hypothetical protein P5693_05990, partial [Limnospira sp. PMC 1290.21]|uniref:hypothetical protein n=1 Tax=unclassified Limnospira TaxID=2642885 RepID=UPI0028E13EFB
FPPRFKKTELPNSRIFAVYYWEHSRTQKQQKWLSPESMEDVNNGNTQRTRSVRSALLVTQAATSNC